ncbi:MAG: hypothetical protein ACP5KN_19045, partial [Armatimonadota bacterium]
MTTERPARTFLRGEAVQFLIHSDSEPQDAQWQIHDSYGTKWATGSVRLGANNTALRVREQLGPGYYTLTLQPASGDRIDEVFCLLPHPDESQGRGGIFGVHYLPRSDEEWQILQQMGTRHLRAECPWTVIEPSMGEFDTTKVDGFIEHALEHDMQLTILTGHTPRHYSEKPIDAEGRVATAWYTWQPRTTVEWYRFIDMMGRRLLGRRLPPDPSHPTDTLARSGRPLVVAWEVWSEADQSFYYGDWDRYLDMLRIAYCRLRASERVPIVYGSCGHWTEMGLTVAANCSDYFDRMAYHPFGDDPQYELMHWFRNMPQVLLKPGVPRETAFTEVDFHAPDREGEPGFILRLYAILRAFRQHHYIRSGCTGGVITDGGTHYALVDRVEDGYRPRPAYVAWAVTRWLLEDARYIGSLNAPDGVRAELFFRDGVPVAVVWTRGGTAAMRLDVAAGAQQMTCLGRRIGLQAPTATVEVSEDACAIMGLSWRYLREAVTNALERRLTTELDHESPHNSAYIGTLEEDAAEAVAPDFPDRVRQAVDRACDRYERRPAHGAAAFFEVQRTVGAGTLQAVGNARAADDLRPVHTNTIWRLAQQLEDLGAVADALGERWRRMNNVSPDDLQRVRAQIRGIRQRFDGAWQGAECPFADRLLDRASEQLRLVTGSGGHRRGAWWAAVLQVRAAHALTAIEPPSLRRVFVALNFPTGRPVTKGTLLEPGPDHVITARVYNFLSHDVSGTLHLQMPETWRCETPTVPFSAPAQGHSDAIPVTFDVPDEPTPWVQKAAWRPSGTLTVDLPKPLPPNEELWVTADLGGGLQSLPMRYRLC